jgi:hypothetical protein
MRAPLRGLAVALACLLIFCLSSFAYAQQSDQIVAERILGPHWKQLSRRAGMIFAGTVLSTTPLAERAMPGPTPAVEVRFRVDEPIAGVEPGQVLTIHEWAGAWSMHRPMINGQHILIFLYPPSRLGLTSPVGGSWGRSLSTRAGRACRRITQTQDMQNPFAEARCPDAANRLTKLIVRAATHNGR